ncbi:MAG: tyrosine-type recombinase/integrase [Xanthobacteraceae bacterium]
MSVRKRTWTTAQGDPKEAWIVDYVVNHVRHQKTFLRKKEADAWATTMKVEVRNGVHVPDSKSITVKEAGERWIKAAQHDGLERFTIKGYRQHLELHILPYLGSVKLSQLSVSHVQELETRLREGKPPFDKPRSAIMVRKVRASLSSILVGARMPHNVVRELTEQSRSQRRRQRHLEDRHRDEIVIPTMAEIKAICEAAQGRWRPLLLTATFTGLRSSELRGLEWSDVDFRKGEIRVRQRADRYNSIGKPKSAAGSRTVPVPPQVLDVLRQWKIECPPGPKGKVLVFPNGKGKIESHANIIERGLIPTVLRAGVADVVKDTDGKVMLGDDGEPQMCPRYTGMHVFRHFFASWCIGRKIDGGRELPAKLVQTWLGHSSIKVTLDVYGHLLPRGDDVAELAAATARIWG